MAVNWMGRLHAKYTLHLGYQQFFGRGTEYVHRRSMNQRVTEKVADDKEEGKGGQADEQNC